MLADRASGEGLLVVGDSPAPVVALLAAPPPAAMGRGAGPPRAGPPRAGPSRLSRASSPLRRAEACWEARVALILFASTMVRRCSSRRPSTRLSDDDCRAPGRPAAASRPRSKDMRQFAATEIYGGACTELISREREEEMTDLLHKSCDSSQAITPRIHRGFLPIANLVGDPHLAYQRLLYVRTRFLRLLSYKYV